MYYVLLCNVYYIEFVKFLWHFLSEISTSAFKNSPHFTGHFNRDVTEHKCIDKLGWAERPLDCKDKLGQVRLNFYKSCAKLHQEKSNCFTDISCFLRQTFVFNTSMWNVYFGNLLFLCPILDTQVYETHFPWTNKWYKWRFFKTEHFRPNSSFETSSNEI